MKQADDRRRILELWLQRPKGERSGEDVLKFYGWLSQHEPGVIPSGTGSYQQLLTILRDHVVVPERRRAANVLAPGQAGLDS